MSKVEVQQPGVETRLKHKRRGFYYDRAPGFVAVGESHERAERGAGEKKLASAAEAGVVAALAKFGLLQRKDADPVEVLSELFSHGDYGLPVKGDPARARPTGRLASRSFAGASPVGSAGSAMEGSSALQPDVATAYHGA